MRAHRTRMLAAVLGTAVLVTGIAPGAVLAAKPADHGNPHATAPAPEPSADPSVDPSVDPVEPTPEPTAEPIAEPTEAPAVTPDPTEAPVKSVKPDVEREATPDGGAAQPVVVPDVVDAPTTLTFVVSPETFAAGDAITITATVSPIPSCGTIEITYNGTTSSDLVPDGAGQASVSTTAAPGLKFIDATYSGCVGFEPSSATGLTDTRVIPELSLETDRSTAIQHEQPVTLTATFLVNDATGTVTFWRFVDLTPQALGTATVSGDSATLVKANLPVGSYEIFATYGGDSMYLPSNDSNAVAVTITADTSVKTTSLAVQYSRFYPRNDGYRDTDKISGKTLEPASVTIRIYTSGGTRVKTFSLGTKNGTYSATWDGRKKDGSLFAQGTYTVKQSFTDGRSNTKTVNQTITLSHKKLYWTTASQTRYADSGGFGAAGDGGAFRSNTWSRGVVLYGGGSAGSYAFARYTFTLPSATIYSSLRASAYGRTMSGFGQGYIGIRNYATDELDAFKLLGSSTAWYSNSTSAAGHLTSDHKAQLWAFAEGDNDGAIDFYKVKLTYKYAVLKY
jgi:hypothetical protein